MIFSWLKRIKIIRDSPCLGYYQIRKKRGQNEPNKGQNEEVEGVRSKKGAKKGPEWGAPSNRGQFGNSAAYPSSMPFLKGDWDGENSHPLVSAELS